MLDWSTPSPASFSNSKDHPIISFLECSILAFFQEFFRGGGQNLLLRELFCYANFSIVFGPNFGGELPQCPPPSLRKPVFPRIFESLELSTSLQVRHYFKVHLILVIRCIRPWGLCVSYWLSFCSFASQLCRTIMSTMVK